MYKLSILLIGILLLTSCELIVIGEKNPKTTIIVYDQTSSIGAVQLFKRELDNENIPAAATILANPEGRKFLPAESYEMYFDIDRIKRAISQKEITAILTDTISQYSYKHKVELNYVDDVEITTTQIDTNWYIIEFKDFIDIH